MLSACGGDDSDTPKVNNITVPAAANLVIEDSKNNGDASDISIDFTKASDEDNIKEYWVVLIKTANINNFKLSDATNLEVGNYQVVAKNGGDHSLFLSATLKDSDGDDLTNETSYTALVVSIATDDENTFSAISLPSNDLFYGDFTVLLRYMGNMGVVISDFEGNQVVIDGLHGNAAAFNTIPTEDMNALVNGEAPWGETDIVMTSHNHGDHINFTATNALLARNSNALYIAPPQSRSNINPASQISQITPPQLTSEVVTHNGIEVKVLHLIHFNQFNNDFSGVENYGFIVNLGGLKILHVGDAFYSNENYAPFDLTNEGIDVLILPTFNTLLSAENRDLVNSLINPTHIIGSHLLTSTSDASVTNLYPSAVIFKAAGDFKKY